MAFLLTNNVKACKTKTTIRHNTQNWYFQKQKTVLKLSSMYSFYAQQSKSQQEKQVIGIQTHRWQLPSEGKYMAYALNLQKLKVYKVRNANIAN